MADDDLKDLTIEFAGVTDAELWALAELAKRIYWEDMRKLATSERETNLMASGVTKLQDALGAAGYLPR
jgi:hypothetical protein